MRFLIAFIAILPLVAAAETGYITDQLRLGLHEAEDTRDRPFRMLESGTQFEVLSRTRLYANVEVPNGDRGWVKAAYIVDETPAKLIVNEAQAETERLRAELEEANRAFAEPAAAIESLKTENASLQSDLETSRARADELEEETSSYRRRAEQYQYSLPVTWVLGAIGVGLVAGFFGGLRWVDHRSRKRHGGIRIY